MTNARGSLVSAKACTCMYVMVCALANSKKIWPWTVFPSVEEQTLFPKFVQDVCGMLMKLFVYDGAMHFRTHGRAMDI